MASDKKRKRQSEGAGGSASKKIAFEKSSDVIKVSSAEAGGNWQAVIANSPGLAFPQTAKFTAYTRGQDENSALFLHADQHPTLDYTASEESLDTVDSLAHYVGIYDPRGQNLELVPARQLTVRSTLKASRAQEVEAKSEGPAHQSPQKLSSRSELGLAFGTKKSKKAIQARAANAIVSTKPVSEDKVASAILESMPAQTVKKQDLQAQVDAARPIPTPNLAGQTPGEVYTIATLVGGDEFLAKIKAKDWIDTLEKFGDMQTRSLFVSRRSMRIAKTGDIKMMRVLRYLYLLICWFKSLRPGKAQRDTSMFIPKFGELSLTANHEQQPFMQELVREFGKDFLPHLSDRFSEDGVKLTRWHQDRLISYICALVLVIDAFETDTYEIQFDLKLDVKKMTDYFKGLGCGAQNFTKREIEIKGLARVQALDRKKVTLKVPVKLPQGRGFVQRRK